MTTVSLELVNKNIIALKHDVDQIKDLLEESTLELRDEVKNAIINSRKRHSSQFKTQAEIEKKFL